MADSPGARDAVQADSSLSSLDMQGCVVPTGRKEAAQPSFVISASSVVQAVRCSALLRVLRLGYVAFRLRSRSHSGGVVSAE